MRGGQYDKNALPPRLRDKALVKALLGKKAFVIEKALGIFHKDLSFPPAARATIESFSDLYNENLVGLLW